MFTDAQVKLLRRKMAEGKTIASAAAAAGMSERSAYAWKQGPLPGETREPRGWRTRPDPFSTVWEPVIVPLLAADTGGVLEATTVIDELRRRHGDAYGPGQLRTLQRRMQEWRALHGGGKEVMFEQRHEAGREGAFDFTDAAELAVTIAGRAFAHLLFEFVLSFSKWRWVGLAFSETFEALVHGLQEALAAIGGCPAVWRSDNLSAATHQIPGGGRELNRRFAAVLDHYGASSTRIEPGESHQNGIAEKAHHRLKSSIAQALVVRGSHDFASIDTYMGFVGAMHGGSGSESGGKHRFNWGVPQDIEDLVHCATDVDFLAYVRGSKNEFRAWPTAPLALRAERAGVTEELASEYSSRISSSPSGVEHYDVALSFAGPDRPHAARLAELLESAGVRVFYDGYEEASLWGKDLYAHLHEVYSERSTLCVIFVSASYARRVWTNHERRAAQERALNERREYILPIKVDATTLPGLPETVGYIELTEGVEKIARLLLEKLDLLTTKAIDPDD